MDNNLNCVTVTSQRLVNGVIDHLEHHVVEAGTVVGIADIHPWTLPYRIEAFKNLNTGRIVTLITHSVHSSNLPCSTWNTLLATGCQTSVSFSLSMLVIKT